MTVFTMTQKENKNYYFVSYLYKFKRENIPQLSSYFVLLYGQTSDNYLYKDNIGYTNIKKG